MCKWWFIAKQSTYFKLSWGTEKEYLPSVCTSWHQGNDPVCWPTTEFLHQQGQDLSGGELHLSQRWIRNSMCIWFCGDASACSALTPSGSHIDLSKNAEQMTLWSLSFAYEGRGTHWYRWWKQYMRKAPTHKHKWSLLLFLIILITYVFHFTNLSRNKYFFLCSYICIIKGCAR